MSEMSGRCTTRAPTSSSPSTKAPSRTTTRWSALHTRRASTSRPDSPSACRRCRRSRSTPARRRRRCPGRPRPAAQRLTAHVTLNHRPQPPWPPAGKPVHKHPHLAPQQLCRSPWHKVPGAGRGTKLPAFGQASAKDRMWCRLRRDQPRRSRELRPQVGREPVDDPAPQPACSCRSQTSRPTDKYSCSSLLFAARTREPRTRGPADPRRRSGVWRWRGCWRCCGPIPGGRPNGGFRRT